jgi:hypothetical protein
MRHISIGCGRTCARGASNASSSIEAKWIARRRSHFCEADILSVPATYAEPKGMFLLEAMACGVPVMQPRQRAFPEIIENTGAGFSSIPTALMLLPMV